MKKPAFRQFWAGKYGYQIVFVDDADADLLVDLRVALDGTRLKFIVADPRDMSKRTSLAGAVARRHVKRPAAEYDCVGYRNGSPCDCRASNLYWATRRQLTGSGRVTFKQRMACAPTLVNEPAA